MSQHLDVRLSPPRTRHANDITSLQKATLTVANASNNMSGGEEPSEKPCSRNPKMPLDFLAYQNIGPLLQLRVAIPIVSLLAPLGAHIAELSKPQQRCNPAFGPLCASTLAKRFRIIFRNANC